MLHFFALIILTTNLFLAGIPSESFSQKSKFDISGGIYELSADGKKYAHRNNDEEFLLNEESAISFSELINVTVSPHEFTGQDMLILHWSDSAKVSFARMTERNLQKPLAIVLNHQVISAPIVQDKISGGQVSVTMSDEDRYYYLREFGLIQENDK